MAALIIRRLLQSAAVLLAVGFLAFALFQYVGDPVAIMLGQDTTAEERVRFARELGLDQPFFVQFARFLANALKGEFGISYKFGRPVATLFAERIPATLELSFFAAGMALMLGIPMGVLSAKRPDSWLARAVLAFSLLGVAVPTFLTGILLILVFSVVFGWLPSFGRGEVVHLGLWSTGLLTASGFKALVLPTINLVLFQLAVIVRLTRSEMQEVLRSDYIRFARARGLSDPAVYYGHALRNALIPVVTIAGLELGSVIAFAIVTETVFQWPGMGFLFIQAVQAADIPVMAGYLCFVALVFVLINTVIDLLYYLIDPRLRAEPSPTRHDQRGPRTARGSRSAEIRGKEPNA